MTTTTTASNVQTFTYDQLKFWADSYSNSRFNEYADVASKYGVGEEQALLQFLDEGSAPIHVWKAEDGTYKGWFYQATEQVTQTNPLNSNVSTVSRGTLRQMVGQKFEDVGGILKRNLVKYPATGGLGDKAAYLLGSAGSAYLAASTGIALGKTIDSVLYNLNPNFWDSIGLGTLNPDTWAGLIDDGSSPFGGMMNFILGLDPETGNSQMYINEDAYAYLAYCMAKAGVFATSSEVINPTIGAKTLNTPIYRFSVPLTIDEVTETSISYRAIVLSIDSQDRPSRLCVNAPIEYAGIFGDHVFLTQISGYWWTVVLDVTLPDELLQRCTFSYRHPSGGMASQFTNYTYDSKTVTYSAASFGGWTIDPSGIIPRSASNSLEESAWVIRYGTHSAGPIDGFGNQEGATLPNTSTWTNPANTLTSLQQQYPDMWNNALVWDNDADDGTAKQTTWIPIPSAVATYASDPQPTSGDQTQSQTNVAQFPETLIQTIVDIIQQTQTQTEPQPQIPPSNPTDTGIGTTDEPLLPTGNASALWSVYHPTQAQVNSFGAWLWSDDFLTNILKIMNDPMSGIITLHKVFATPVDSGSGTIVVGKLDSEVPSATVNQQYVTVDCGSVDLLEQFGNVFDYNPFTDVSLYLPFIGIVPLDVADVMRSTINVVYGVDVYTGACLAQVYVYRDGNTVNMYQYSGVCSVEYPLTGAQHNGLVSGLFSIAAGVSGLVMGNLPMAVGGTVGGIASSAKRSQSRANSFSGNSGAMGIKTPYLIISRPQTKVASTFPQLQGYPTNTSVKLGNCSGQVRVRAVHVEGIDATDTELREIENLLKSGVLI